MSGPGGYTGDGGGGPDSDRGTSCDRLIFETDLQSVNVPVARRIKEGEKLRVVIKGPDHPIVGHHRKHGDVGSIISRIPELLRCHEQGHSYEAEVLVIQNTRVHVRVAPE